MNTLHMFLNNHYQDHLIVLCAVGYGNFLVSGPTFRRFYQDLTWLQPKQKYIAWSHAWTSAGWNCTFSGMLLNQIYILQMFFYDIIMSWMVSNCTQNFCSTRHKQYNQSHSDHDKVIASKCIWSYLSQFFTFFNEPGSEIDGNKHGNTGV